MVDARQDVEERSRRRHREANAVGHDRRHAKRRRQRRQHAGVALFVATEVTLQLDVDVGAPEDPDEAIEQPADAVAAAVEHGAAGERHQSTRPPVEIVEPERALPFRRAQLHARDQPAEVLVALLGLTEHRKRKGKR